MSPRGEESPRTLADRCRAIRVLVVDVDGVLTEGGIVYGDTSSGSALELKSFHVRDGSGLKLWRKAGKSSALITGRQSRLVEVRAAELDIEWVIQGARVKGPAFEQVAQRAGVPPEEICYIGDDLPDLEPLERAGLAVGVADACSEVRALAHYVTRQPGGRGAVREVIERILRCQGLWRLA